MTVASSLRVVNPATGTLLAEVPVDAPEAVAAAVARARQAQPGWAALTFRERARRLRQLVRRLARDEELIALISAESGKPRFEAEGIEVFYTCELTRYLTGGVGRRSLADQVRRPFVFANKRARVVTHPHGVVGVIGPWNWPLLNNFADAIAPLAAGNAVVLKPSPLTPLTSLRVAALWRLEGLPEGVFQVVNGGAEAGEALVKAVDMIFFTGSHAVGKSIAHAAAERLIPAVLELGGKSPMIVLADADLPRAAHAAAWSAFANSGQVCIRTERVIVETAVADRFTDLLVAEVGRLRQGAPSPEQDGVDGGPDVGAMVAASQMDHVERQIADAVRGGARVVAGGQRRTDLPGQFFQPTVLVDVSPEMAVARQESFGPVLPIIKVADAEAAIDLANSVGQGLSGSIWSKDARRAGALARRVQTGSICVNDALMNYFVVEAPLGGVRGSGLGFRHGPEALRQFCRIETIVEDCPFLGWTSGFVGRQTSFPYRPSVLRLIRRLIRIVY